MINLFVSTHNGISGSLINALDYGNYLCTKGFKIGILDYLGFIKNLKLSKREYSNITPDKLEIIKNIDVNILVLDYISLINLTKMGMSIKCKTLIVFDCLELTFHLRGISHELYISERIDELPIQYETIQFNVTPFIYDDFKKMYPKIQVKKYLKKIDVKALKTIKTIDNGKSFCRVPNKDVEFIKDMTLQNIFNYNTFYYFTRENFSLQEQFGRIIFEFKLLGKNVIIDKIYDNGLKNYLDEYWDDIEKINIWNYTLEEILCIS